MCRLTYETSFIADLDLLDVAEYIYYSSSFRTNILEEICSFKVEFPESSPKGFEFPKKGIKSGFRGTSPMPKTYSTPHNHFISVFIENSSRSQVLCICNMIPLGTHNL